MYMGVRNIWAIHISKKQNRVIHILSFFKKNGIYHIPGSAEKGGYSASTSVLCHI